MLTNFFIFFVSNIYTITKYSKIIRYIFDSWTRTRLLVVYYIKNERHNKDYVYISYIDIISMNRKIYKY